MDLKPVIGISMGDPFGNGPEITVKSLSDRSVYEKSRPVVVGDRSSMEYAAAVAGRLGGQKLKLNVIKDISEAKFEFGTIDLGHSSQ